MEKVAFLFPGQGSQYVGMGSDLYQKYDLVKELYDKAEKILRFDIKELCFNGPPEELKKTEICQPAIFLHSMILIELLKEKDYATTIIGSGTWVINLIFCLPARYLTPSSVYHTATI